MNEEKEDIYFKMVIDYCNKDVERIIKINEIKGWESTPYLDGYVAMKIPLVEGDIDDSFFIENAIERCLAHLKSKLTIVREVVAIPDGSLCSTERAYTISFKKSELKTI